MLKHVYRVIVLIAVFSAAVYIFAKNIEEVTVDLTKTVEVGGNTFPVLHLKSSGRQINRLYGYSGNLNANMVRESITPMAVDKTLDISIQEFSVQVQRIKYELRDVETNELLDNGSVTALDVTESGKSARIKIRAELNTSTEYALKLTAMTNTGRKINYFTRTKYYIDEAYLNEKLDFALEFHQNTLKMRQENIVPYLEPKPDQDNTTLSLVNIHSTYEQITWAGLKPKVVSEIIPNIKEFNMETASIQISYFIEAKTDTGLERFQVQEFYRVRYTKDRIYLLYFERTMEAMFDENLMSIKQKELKLGITSGKDFQVVENMNKTKISFKRSGALYYFNLDENKLIQIYSFFPDQPDYEHGLYSEQDIHIIKIDEDGNVHFAVYGYITRGDYEGKVAIVLYKFHAAENCIEELVYIPLSTTYQMLKKDFSEYSYVNGKDNFYFTMQGNIYSYNTIAKSLNVIAENVTGDNFQILKEKNCYVWADAAEKGVSENINILNLDSGETTIISAPKNQKVRMLGTIDSNIIYGFVRKKDITQTTDGTMILPAYRLEITDVSGKILKKYPGENSKKYYITNVTIQGNKITMERVQKVHNGSNVTYEEAAEDEIMNQLQVNIEEIRLSPRTAEKALKEWYVTLPSGSKIEKIPEKVITQNLVISRETSMHLNEAEPKKETYYVYAYGGITDASENPAKAIRFANDKMGVVISSHHQLVWERGGRFTSHAISGIEKTTAIGRISSVGASIYMLLKANLISADAAKLSAEKGSICDIISKYMDYPVNLTGCTLDEVLYFISEGKPVIAMKNKNEAVLLTAYDAGTVTMVDPATGTESAMYLSTASNLFESAGNVFVSYLKNRE